MKYITTLSILVFCFASLSFESYACSCIAPSAPLVELESSDFVFSGVVKSITPINSNYGRNLLIRIQVLSRWKGDVSKDVVVQTADNSAACGYPFERGKSYLIYGHVYENVLHTGICTRTKLLKNAQEDLRDLDTGEEVSTYSPRCGGPTNAIMIQTFLFLFIGIFVIQRASPARAIHESPYKKTRTANLE